MAGGGKTDDDAGCSHGEEEMFLRHPVSSQPSFLNVKTYTILMSLIFACCSAGTAIIIGTVTTLQRAFGFSSTQIGVIQASYSVGYAGSILFISHFAERSHKPRWVAAGAAAVAVSCLLPLLPHFALWLPAHRNAMALDVALPYSSGGGGAADGFPASRSGLCHVGGGASAVDSDCPSISGAAKKPDSVSNGVAYVLFAVASAFAGLGNSPLNTVGMTYIDENVPKQDSAFYMGIPMSMYAVGPVLGFFFHAYVMQFHADVFPPRMGADVVNSTTTLTTAKTLTTTDPDFVGAWWISYLIVGCTISCLAGFALAFPRRLGRRLDDDSEGYKEEEREGKEEEEEEETGGMAMKRTEEGKEEREEEGESKAIKVGNGPLLAVEKIEGEDVRRSGRVSSPSLWLHIKSLLAALADLLSNPVYLSTLVGSACFSTGMTGLFYFFPKIIEHQFGVTAIVSNVCFGIVEIPVGLGMFFGGYLIKKFQFSPRGAALFTPLLQSFGVAAVTTMLFVRCAPDRFASMDQTTSSFSSSSSSSSPSASFSSFSLSKGVFTNLTLECNAACGCRHDEFKPVCGDDRVTYLNPCHAGCQRSPSKAFHLVDDDAFTNCSCTSSGTARPGACVSVPSPDSTLPAFVPCARLVAYMVVFLVATLAFFLTRMTIINVCIRAAGDDKRGLALGLRSFFGNIMGNLASSVLFGVIIDDSCVLWREELAALNREAAAVAVNGDVDCAAVLMGDAGGGGGGGGGSGDCLVYASTRFHFLTHGFAGILDFMGVGFFFVAYVLARNQPWAATQGTSTTTAATTTASSSSSSTRVVEEEANA